MIQEARDKLAMANRILAHEGVLDAFGHVSLRHPQDPGKYLLSRSLAPSMVRSEDILEFWLDSTRSLASRMRRSTPNVSFMAKSTRRGPMSWRSAITMRRDADFLHKRQEARPDLTNGSGDGTTRSHLGQPNRLWRHEPSPRQGGGGAVSRDMPWPNLGRPYEAA